MMASSHSFEFSCMCDTTTEHEHFLLYGILAPFSASPQVLFRPISLCLLWSWTVLEGRAESRFNRPDNLLNPLSRSFSVLLRPRNDQPLMV